MAHNEIDLLSGTLLFLGSFLIFLKRSLFLNIGVGGKLALKLWFTVSQGLTVLFKRNRFM